MLPNICNLSEVWQVLATCFCEIVNATKRDFQSTQVTVHQLIIYTGNLNLICHQR